MISSYFLWHKELTGTGRESTFSSWTQGQGWLADRVDHRGVLAEWGCGSSSTIALDELFEEIPGGTTHARRRLGFGPHNRNSFCFVNRRCFVRVRAKELHPFPHAVWTYGEQFT